MAESERIGKTRAGLSLNADNPRAGLSVDPSTKRAGQQGVDIIPPEQQDAPPRPPIRPAYLGVAALIAAGLGYFALVGGNSQPDLTIEVITDPRAVQAEIDKQVDPALKRQLQARLDRKELELWRYRIHAAPAQAAGQTYTVDTHLPGQRRTYALSGGAQSFDLFATSSTMSFGFSADRNPTATTMDGVWRTGAGTLPYTLSPGQAKEIPARSAAR
jgi:hypothetical protein